MAASPIRRLRRAVSATAFAVVGVLGVLGAFAVPALANGGSGGGSGGSGGGGGGGTVTPALSSIVFSPATVVGGGGDTATVSFVTPPSQGAVVHLTSSAPGVVTFGTPVPEQGGAVVQPGRTGVAVPLITTAVTVVTQVTVTATAFGTTTVTAVLTVTPGTPPPADTVHVTKFTWAKGLQTIQATDSNPTAVLNAYSSLDGSWLGITLTNSGGGSFQDQRGEVFPPDAPIVVRSDFGGSATAGATVSH